jgi:hypothetical protein
MADRRFWAVDKVILGYLVFTGILLVGWWRAIPDAPALAAAHVGGVALLLIEIKARTRPVGIFAAGIPCPTWGPATRKWRCWSRRSATRAPTGGWPPWIFVFGARIPPSGWSGSTARRSPNICSWCTRCLCRRCCWCRLCCGGRRRGEFQYYAFLIALGYLASYVGYLGGAGAGAAVSAETLATHAVTRVVAVSKHACRTLDRLESYHYDCFPSGHTELTILACWSSRLYQTGGFGSISATLCSSFLLQFIFDTTIRSICSPGQPWR